MHGEAAQAVERADCERGARRQAVPLEEADVDGDARRTRRDREVHVRGGELERVHGTEGQWHGRRAQSRARLCETWSLRDDEAHGDDPPRRVAQRLAELVEVDPADDSEQSEERDDEECRLEHCSLGDAPELLQLGRFCP